MIIVNKFINLPLFFNMYNLSLKTLEYLSNMIIISILLNFLSNHLFSLLSSLFIIIHNLIYLMTFPKFSLLANKLA